MEASPAADLRVAVYGAVLAHEVRTHLAVAAVAHAAFHVGFHGQVDPVAGQSAGFELPDHEAHHDFRAAGHRDGLFGFQLDVLEQFGDDSDVAAPACAAAVYRGEYAGIRECVPGFQFLGEEHFLGTASAVEDNEAPV